ncbi:MAG: helix-turn-helix transcriptional regulator [Gudongella sp.]|jgi:transcriptional regulator with XRE-family HTH domain|nr:helix-turn-helix transcriptional regulator [Gudongella sp.]
MNNLKAVRLSKGMSQFELAKLSNVGPGEISRLENGKIFPYPGWRQKLAEALQVSEETIFPDVQEEDEK